MKRTTTRAAVQWATRRAGQLALALLASPRREWPTLAYDFPRPARPAGQSLRPFAQGAPGRAGRRRDGNGDDPLGMLASLALVGAGVVAGFVLAVITGALGALIRRVIG